MIYDPKIKDIKVYSPAERQILGNKPFSVLIEQDDTLTFAFKGDIRFSKFAEKIEIGEIEASYYLKDSCLLVDEGKSGKIITIQVSSSVLTLDTENGTLKDESGRVLKSFTKDFRKLPQSFEILTLGREELKGGTDKTDQYISRSHLSIIHYQAENPTNDRQSSFLILDHSTNGTRITLERKRQGIVNNDQERENSPSSDHPVHVRHASHRQQQIKGDQNSFGGDYYLTGKQFLSSKILSEKEINDIFGFQQLFPIYQELRRSAQNLLSKGGNPVVLMDTVTNVLTSDGKEFGNSQQTKKYAFLFLLNYYEAIKEGCDPEEACKLAYGRTNRKGVFATFNFSLILQDRQDGEDLLITLFVGNTRTYVFGGENIKIQFGNLEVKAGGTPVVCQYEKPFCRKMGLSGSDKVFVATDGVMRINPNNPKESIIIKSDDALLIELKKTN